MARDRRAELQHHPIGILRTATAVGAKLGNARNSFSYNAVDITTAGGAQFTLFVDSSTKLPARVVSMTYNTNLGDVVMETDFADYKEVDGLKLPARITSKLDK